MSDFADNRMAFYGAQPPVPMEGVPPHSGNMYFVGRPGQWDPDELTMQTAEIEVPVLGYDGGDDYADDTQPEHEAQRSEPQEGVDFRYAPDGVTKIHIWRPQAPPRVDARQGEGLISSAKKVVLGAFAGAVIVVGVGGYILFSRTGWGTPRQPGIVLTGHSSPMPGMTPPASKPATPNSKPTVPASPTATPGAPNSTPTPKPNPTETPTPPPAPTPGPKFETSVVPLTLDGVQYGKGSGIHIAYKTTVGGVLYYVTDSGDQLPATDFANANDSGLIAH